MSETAVQILQIVGTVLASLLTATGIVTVGVMTYRNTRKGDKTTAVLTEKRDTIADRDSLIDQLQEDVQTLRSDMEAQKAETKALREEVREVRDHNNALTTFVYKMIAIFRRHNLTDQIDPKDVPYGIHI